MPAYMIRITDGQAVTQKRGNLFETVACADQMEKAISDALIYTPPALKGGRLVIEVRPVPIIR